MNRQFAYALLEARAALKFEINSPNGMIISRAVNARTIIPWLFRHNVTEVKPPYTRKRKIQAWNDLNNWMVKRGFEPGILERAKTQEAK